MVKRLMRPFGGNISAALRAFLDIEQHGRAFVPPLEKGKAAHCLSLGGCALDGNALRTLLWHGEETSLQRVLRLINTHP
jgi:hypothetical protein